MFHFNSVIKVVLALLCLQQLAFAGVVEDAEEELRKLNGERGEIRHSVFPSGFGSEQRAEQELRPQVSVPSTTAERHRTVDSASSGSPGGGGQGSGLGAGDKSEPVENDKPVRRSNKRLNKDRYFSLVGLAFFVVLILLAASFAKNGDSDS